MGGSVMTEGSRLVRGRHAELRFLPQKQVTVPHFPTVATHRTLARGGHVRRGRFPFLSFHGMVATTRGRRHRVDSPIARI